MTVRPAVIPVLRYADAPRAIDFLCAAFGFVRYAVYSDAETPSQVDHAELVWAGQMIIVLRHRDTLCPRSRHADGRGGGWRDPVALSGAR